MYIVTINYTLCGHSIYQSAVLSPFLYSPDITSLTLTVYVINQNIIRIILF